MKIFAIIKDNIYAKILFVIIAFIIIFNRVLYKLILDSFNSSGERSEESVAEEPVEETSEESKEEEPTEETSEEIYNGTLSEKTKEGFDNIFSKLENNNTDFNVYPNIEEKPHHLIFNKNKFTPECCVLNYEYSSSDGCPCITPEQQYYLQYRGNKNKCN